VVAELDLLANFAHVAALRNYARPTLTEECVLEAAAARHPVVELILGQPSLGESRAQHPDGTLAVRAAR